MRNRCLVVLIWYFLKYCISSMMLIFCFQNEVEASHILHLARKLQEQDRNYRVITGYEGQRSHIENLMKVEGLEWGDKCFSVDSFQGIFHSLVYDQFNSTGSQEMRKTSSSYPLSEPCA